MSSNLVESRVILTADIHLDLEVKNAYRWRIFDKLALLGNKDSVLIILGDYVVNKDNHSLAFLNQFYDSIKKLSLKYKEVLLLLGNHDYKVLGSTVIGPLRSFSNIVVFEEPTVYGGAAFIPASHSPVESIKSLNCMPGSAVFLHHGFSGVRLSNGTLLNTDLKVNELPDDFIYFSGDIHIPQMAGNKVLYLGSPHPINYDDSFDCFVYEKHRDLVFASGNLLKIPSGSIIKRTVNSNVHDVDESVLDPYNEGDQIKVKVSLDSVDQSKSKALQDKVSSICDAAAGKGVSVIFEYVYKGTLGDGSDDPQYFSINTLSEEFDDIFSLFVEENGITDANVLKAFKRIVERAS